MAVNVQHPPGKIIPLMTCISAERYWPYGGGTFKCNLPGTISVAEEIEQLQFFKLQLEETNGTALIKRERQKQVLQGYSWGATTYIHHGAEIIPGSEKTRPEIVSSITTDF